MRKLQAVIRAILDTPHRNVARIEILIVSKSNYSGCGKTTFSNKHTMKHDFANMQTSSVNFWKTCISKSCDVKILIMNWASMWPESLLVHSATIGLWWIRRLYCCLVTMITNKRHVGVPSLPLGSATRSRWQYWRTTWMLVLEENTNRWGQ